MLQNAHGLTWSNQHRQGQGQQVTPTLRALQLRADGSGPHVLLAAGSHTAIILSPQGHTLDLLTLPVSFLFRLPLPCMICTACPLKITFLSLLAFTAADAESKCVQTGCMEGVPWVSMLCTLLASVWLPCK